MKRRIHEGILYQDQHKRYYLYESGVPPHKMLTRTSGRRLEVWLNRTWIAGHVEGDGDDYRFFLSNSISETNSLTECPLRPMLIRPSL